MDELLEETRDESEWLVPPTQQEEQAEGEEEENIPHTPYKPLKGVVIVPSLYEGKEMELLKRLAKRLGATVEGSYARSQNAVLLCPQPTGRKYRAAIKWGKCRKLYEKGVPLRTLITYGFSLVVLAHNRTDGR